MNYSAYSVQTNFGCSGIVEYGPLQQNLVSSISLPDGTSYTIAYETTPGHSANVTGRISSITLPTGGTISYSYSGGSNGITCADGSTATLKRTTPDGTWTYAHTESGTAWTTTLTDPQGNDTVLNFQGLYETERKTYQGSSTTGTVLVTADTCYNGATVPCTSTAITLPITQRTITTTLPGSSNLKSQAKTLYNTFGLPTETDEYAYGNGAVGSLVRQTKISYAALGNNISDRPSSIAVYDGAATLKAQTTYSYDQMAVVATTGTPQHVAVSGSRGNLTTATLTTAGSSTISRTFTYFDTGTVKTATDFNSAQTTNTYGTSSCGNSFVTSVSLPLSLSRSMTWDCNGGALSSATDENGQTTSLGYGSDPFWRVKVATPPATASTNIAYSTNPPYTESTLTNSNGLTTDVRTNFDVLERVIQKVLESDPTGADHVDTAYDSLGRVLSVSNSYRSTSDSTYGKETYAYDALSRLTSVTRPDSSVASTYYGAAVSGNGGIASQLCSSGTYGLGYPSLSVDEVGFKHQFWSDALGRTIEVDEPDPNNSNSLDLNTCHSYDALDNLVQVSQGSQTRTYAYDALSRVTSATTPESGTTSYSYTTSGGALCAATRAPSAGGPTRAILPPPTATTR